MLRSACAGAIIAGSVVMVVALSSCTVTISGVARSTVTSTAKSSPPGSTAVAPSTGTTTAPPANVNSGPFKINDSVKFDGGLVGRVKNIQNVVSTGNGFPPDSGNRYVGVQIDVTNSDATSSVFTPLLQAELRDPSGKTYDATPLSGYEPEAPNGDIKPQQTASGVVVFEIPANYDFSAGAAAGFVFVFRGGLGGDDKVEIQLG